MVAFLTDNNNLEPHIIGAMFFHRIFAKTMDDETFKDLQQLGNMEFFFDDSTENEELYYAQLKQSIAEEKLLDIAVDYASLFVGPAALKAPPWSSTYLSDESEIFTSVTMWVEAYYKKYHVILDNKDREPCDHFALEFNFLAILLNHYLHCANAEAENYIKKDIETFLQEHFLFWLPKVLQKVVDNSQTNFYKSAAMLALEVIKRWQ